MWPAGWLYWAHKRSESRGLCVARGGVEADRYHAEQLWPNETTMRISSCVPCRAYVTCDT